MQILAADEGVAQVAPALQEREAFLWAVSRMRSQSVVAS